MPLDEARFFLSTVGPLDPDDELWLDLEWVYDANNVEITLADQGSWAYDWLTTVEALSGHTPGIYSSIEFMRDHGLLVPKLQRFPLWLTAYDGKPDVPEGWTVRIWQTSGRGHVGGIEGFVDTDVAVDN